jgi:hypothetical protein
MLKTVDNHPEASQDPLAGSPQLLDVAALSSILLAWIEFSSVRNSALEEQQEDTVAAVVHVWEPSKRRAASKHKASTILLGCIGRRTCRSYGRRSV